MAQYAQNLVFQGIGTISVTVPFAGMYVVESKSSLPTLTNGGGVSALVTTINKNGSAQYTGTAGATGARTNFVCAAGDVIAVVYSSANAVDNALNAIKSTISIYQGE